MRKSSLLPALTAMLAVNFAAPAPASDSAAALQAVLDAQPEASQARYRYRHPLETLRFFGIEPGMTVVEVLPDSGWYTKILLPYLGGQGHLIGADYAQDIWPLFGFFGDEFIAGKTTWLEDWPEQASAWRGEAATRITAFKLGSMPASLSGTADAVLLIRALHNLARFESQGGHLTTALANLYGILKPGGIVGVVQHQAREEMPDDWADGSRGYLKKSFVVRRLEQAGFEFVGSSAINENGRDRPTTDDFVWRLPPTYATSRADPELQATLGAIGESNRMTLKFVKPE